MVEMRVAGIALDAASRSPIVLLRDPSGRRQVPIWIDQAQAQNILAGLSDDIPPRPLSHDLMASLLEIGGLTLERVIIHAIEDNTFRAVLKLSGAGGGSELDARPSDAIALALRSGSSIWMPRPTRRTTPTSGVSSMPSVRRNWCARSRKPILKRQPRAAKRTSNQTPHQTLSLTPTARLIPAARGERSLADAGPPFSAGTPRLHRFGRGRPVSAFSLGTMRAVESPQQMATVLQAALAAGIRHIETAPAYGPPPRSSCGRSCSGSASPGSTTWLCMA